MNKSELELNILTTLNIPESELGGLMARCKYHGVRFYWDTKLSTLSFPDLNNHYIVIILINTV